MRGEKDGMRFPRFAFVPGVALALATFPAWASNIVTDPNFSSPTAYPAGGSFPGYTNVNGWTSSTSGVDSGNNGQSNVFWDNGAAPSGIFTVGFLEVKNTTTTDSFSQVLNLTPGTVYDFSYAENARTGSTATPVVKVLLDSTILVAQSTVTPVDTATHYVNPFVTVSGSFTATSSTQTLQFLVSQKNPGDDSTFLVTNVVVFATPEPGTAGLMSLALAACCIAVSTLRRKRANALPAVQHEL
jgi:hypothetical protein